MMKSASTPGETKRDLIEYLLLLTFLALASSVVFTDGRTSDRHAQATYRGVSLQENHAAAELSVKQMEASTGSDFRFHGNSFGLPTKRHIK
jgi:hypothetical protein